MTEKKILFDIDAHSGIPIYRQIINQVRRQIMSGQLKEGDRLEQVRSLAARLKVNPMTISKAYGYLDQEGLVSLRKGVGLFVGKLKNETKRRMKNDLLESVMKKAAASAVQMDISEEEGEELFKKYYRKYKSQKSDSKKGALKK